MEPLSSRRAGRWLACIFCAYPMLAEADGVVVTATRSPQLADRVLAPVIVITRDEIERSLPTDPVDRLRFHAGIDISRNGGPGQTTSLFLRGTDSNQTLVLIDGVRMNSGTIGIAAIQNIEPALIERIEVVKGPRSTLYGSDAIGGVINIITRRPEDGTGINASIGGGTFDTKKAAAGIRHAGGDSRIGIDASGYKTDGFPPRTDSDIDGGYDNTSVNAYAGHRFDWLDVELSYFGARGNTEYLDFFLAPLDQDFLNSVSTLTLEAQPNAIWVSTLELSQVKDQIDQNQSDDFAHTDRYLVDWKNDVQIGRAHLVTAGAYLRRDMTDSLQFGTSFDEELDIGAVYLQDSIDWETHSLLGAVRFTDHEAFDGHLIWNLGYGYRWSDATRVILSAGTAFRAPDSTDLFGFGGNQDLEPEESLDIEIGLRHRLTPAQQVSLNVFQNRIDNLIAFDEVSSQLFNIGEARIRGIEAGYEVTAARWRASFEAIVQDPEDLDTGEQLLRRAKHTLTASLVFDGGPYRVGTDLLVTSERMDINDVRLAGYGLVNINAVYVLAKDWQLSAKVENLFDRNYTLAEGFNTMERAYFFQIAWDYRMNGAQP